MDSTPAYEEATGASDRRQQEKPTPLPSPHYAASMTSKPNAADKIVGGNTTGAGANNNPFSGYSFNVAQKGKLILPTALWILIVIAGLCFLSLFATLNKTLIALESVEQNQHDALNVALKEKEASADKSQEMVESKHDHHSGHYKNHEHRHHHNHDQVNSPPVLDLIAEEGSDGMPFVQGPLSLLRLPDWISLEPRPRPVDSVLGGPNIVSPIKMLGELLGRDESDSVPIASGSIIMESRLPQEAGDSETMGIIESMLRQASDIFGNYEKDSNKAPSMVTSWDDRRDNGREPSRPLISANIDKVEINVNSRDNDEDEKSTKPIRKNKMGEEDDNEMFLKSVDDMVAKILSTPEVGSKQSDRPISHIPNISKGPFISSASKIPFDGPVSPLASLLMPYNVIQPPKRQESAQKMPQIPDGMQSIVIALGDVNDGPNDGSEKPEIIDLGSFNLAPQVKHSLVKLQDSNSKFPFAITSPDNNGKPDDPVMSAIAEEMAGSLLNNVAPAQPLSTPMNTPTVPDRIEPIESMPIIMPPKLLMPSPTPEVKPPMQPPYIKVEELTKPKLESSVGDLFNAFFGPPPRPQMFDAPKLKSELPIDEREEVGKGLRLKQENTNGDKVIQMVETIKPKPDTDPEITKPTQAPVAETHSTTAPLVDQFEGAISPSTSLSDDDESQSDVGPFLESIFNNVFSLPQFGNGQEPLKAEAQQSGTSKSEGKPRSKSI